MVAENGRRVSSNDLADEIASRIGGKTSIRDGRPAVCSGRTAFFPSRRRLRAEEPPVEEVVVKTPDELMALRGRSGFRRGWAAFCLYASCMVDSPVAEFLPSKMFSRAWGRNGERRFPPLPPFWYMSWVTVRGVDFAPPLLNSWSWLLGRYGKRRSPPAPSRILTKNQTEIQSQTLIHIMHEMREN